MNTNVYVVDQRTLNLTLKAGHYYLSTFNVTSGRVQVSLTNETQTLWTLGPFSSGIYNWNGNGTKTFSWVSASASGYELVLQNLIRPNYSEYSWVVVEMWDLTV